MTKTGDSFDTNERSITFSSPGVALAMPPPWTMRMGRPLISPKQAFGESHCVFRQTSRPLARSILQADPVRHRNARADQSHDSPMVLAPLYVDRLQTYAHSYGALIVVALLFMLYCCARKRSPARRRYCRGTRRMFDTYHVPSSVRAIIHVVGIGIATSRIAQSEAVVIFAVQRVRCRIPEGRDCCLGDNAHLGHVGVQFLVGALKSRT